MTVPNLFDQYFDLVKETEAPMIFHRWSMISCVSALLGRQVWIPFGSFRIFPNQYMMLIGEPGTRKSSAIKMARKILAKSGYNLFSAEKTTKEKFLLDLEGLEDQAEGDVTASTVMQNIFGGTLDAPQDPKEVYIVADEFNDFMRCGDLEFHSMLGALWDYDDETTLYKQRLKNSKSIAIYQPTINLLGGNTHTGFNEMFPPQALGQGFLSRMLLIFSEPSGKKIAFPEPPDPVHQAQVIATLQEIKRKMNGPMQLTARAKEILQVLYNNYEGFDDIRFTSYFTRRYTHLLKLCIVCAAANQKTTIDAGDVIYANTILKYAEHFMPKALGEFGKAKNSDVSAKILTVLSKSTGPMQVNGKGGLWSQVSSDLDRPEELQKIVDGLQQAGKIQWVNKTESGAMGWLIVRRSIKTNELYCDYSLLREYERIKL